MKTYFSDIIPKIQQYSKKLDDLTILQNQNWVSVNEIEDKKVVYIFRENGQLLISENGFISKAGWEYINKKTILIDTKNGSLLFNQAFLDENIMALKLDGSDGYAFFINESRSSSELKTINNINNFLYTKYIKDGYIKENNRVNKFYCLDTSTFKEYGPYSAPEILSQLKKGRLSSSFYIRRESVNHYKDELSLKELLDI